jgi:hypothetical protein
MDNRERHILRRSAQIVSIFFTGYSVLLVVSFDVAAVDRQVFQCADTDVLLICALF